MPGKKWVSNAGWGCCARDGFNRCACGNDRLSISCHSYEDGSYGYILTCWDCGRRIEIDGNEGDLRRAWNEYNNGASKVVYKLVSAPDTITVYMKPDEDVDSAIKNALFGNVKLERVVSSKQKI